ncbi:class I SAM-dependent methyltransferase [Mucilaginibacter conchicola]|uniref:Class I SAM-dependent methyltransferase n=1 Tax=Mucilaginibacter conchicola TaxID=2303333 RepID=A0A372NT59_9SPHI|nr:class I SAM-dependent methyltransferase [Mucilaginibacter conchicola]RFZ92091.1 class I SAM-dependent methyltransferase [Mucilaginibacter conchicola]
MFNITFARDFLLHRFTSKNRHGLHSPFVYKLVDEVIYDKTEKPAYTTVEQERDKLLVDDSYITVTDLGAGSHVNNNKQKKVSDITLNALKPPKLAKLLYRLAAFAKPNNIIELGTCLGITTLYLREAAPEARLYTLEGCPETAGVAKSVFSKAGVTGINVITGNFDDTLPGVLDGEEKLDLVYIDGNHQYDATIRYFDWCLPKVHEGSMLIFDDIYWSDGMKKAWAEIKNHPQVTATVDLFWIGLVFFKPGQAKEHFKIRF